MGFLLKEALKTLCARNQWSYAVFWKIGCNNSKLLIWEDCYYEPLSSPFPSQIAGTSHLPYRDGEGYSFSSDSQLRIQEEDRVCSLINKMMVNNSVNITGQGILGRAAFTGNHQWILLNNFVKNAYPPEAMEQQQQQPSSNFQLMFNKKLSLPIFTGSRILDMERNPIHVILVDKSINNINNNTNDDFPYHPIKLEIVVLDGDFPVGDNWTSEEFNSHIVKERTGKRPLLTGELNVTMRDGIAPISGDIEFTDNSSWIRSRKFRVAVRVAPESMPNLSNVTIREGMTEAFVVKDHRGELYKKHHPPMLNDEVWRLEKIGKDGAFHKKLSSQGITTVQDFLKLSVVDPHRLRKILGIGMSEKMWDVTIKHAKTCNMGNKLYIYRGPHFTILLNAICQMVRADINGQTLPNRELTNFNRSYIEKLVREAYAKWNDLEEIDGILNDNVALLTQGGETVEQFPNINHEAAAAAYDQIDYFGDKSTAGTGNYVTSDNAQIGGAGCNEWAVNETFGTSSFANSIPYSFSESQSDGDITPTGGGAARWN